MEVNVGCEAEPKDSKPNCRERLEKILAVQRETRNLLSEVVGPPTEEINKADPEPVGALADVECSLRSVERHVKLLFAMVTDLQARL